LGKEGIALSKEPVWVSGISDVKFIAAGAYHTIALTNNGTLWAWGWNEYKQLGISSNIVAFSSKPEAVPGLSHIKAAAGGTYHSLVLGNDGTVFQWGGSDSAPVQVSDLSDVREIASGEAHFIALISDGTVRVWGRNNQGQFGNGTLSAVDSNMPLQSSIHLRSLPNAVFSLQIAGGITPGMVTDKENDVNGDKKVGIAEAVYFLHSASETR
jgi:alpha-tubulin suppressor-like RCC1 family protein